MSKYVRKQGKNRKRIGLKIFCSIIAIFLCYEIILLNYRSNPKNYVKYETTNEAIIDFKNGAKTMVSAHRSGGGIAPEESMLAFKNCLENKSFRIDVFEFDLHITKDEKLVLLHDDTLDRTTDSEKVFGTKKARPENYTYDQLRMLNIGAKFKDEKGNMPYKDLTGNKLPDDIKILSLDAILDYLQANGNFKYIIEIKNGGELGFKACDILYKTLKERKLLNDVIFGTFKKEVSHYVDEHCPGMMRSAGLDEVPEFYAAVMQNKKDFKANYVALQIPYNLPYRFAVNLGTIKLINYAHKNNIAVQYWTINDKRQLEYLSSIGADCIMSDYPDKAYDIVYKK